MYRTCMFCNRPLGSNQVIEHFPVGRRLAFHEAKGRLWVVCRKCLRWNLTPLEERWEAIEECERIYRDTPVRVSTDNIDVPRRHRRAVSGCHQAPARHRAAARARLEDKGHVVRDRDLGVNAFTPIPPLRDGCALRPGSR